MSVQAITAAMAIRNASPSEKLLLLVLANYADEHMRCWPSQRRLADDTCLTDRTIRKLLSDLEQRGIITRTERQRDDGSRASDVIHLRFDGAPISGGAEMVSGGVRKQLPGGAEMVSGLTTFEPSTEPSKDTDGEPEGFAEWWEAYPRKLAKGAARKAYRAALKKTDAGSLLASLRAYSFSDVDRFVPHGATWLNDERWLDSSDPPPSVADAMPADPWPGRMIAWRLNSYWNSEWGPKPGKPGFQGPQAIEQAA